MRKFIPVSLIFFFCLISIQSFCQVQPDSSKLCKVETHDGNEFIGLMVAEDSLAVVLETSLLGKVSIPRNSIKAFTWLNANSMKAGQLWFENPQSTRYFWAPNGYGLKKGEGYYQNIWVLWNQASVGVTNYFSVGAGMVPLFFFGGTATPVWIVPKFSFPVVKDKFNVGAGAIAGTLLGEGAGFGIIYGLGTVGNRNNNLTVGFGFAFAEGDWASSPVITVSGMARVGARGYLLTENYYFRADDEGIVIMSFGGRSIIKKAGLDYGLFIPITSEMDSFIAIPWLGITLPFGSTKK